MTADVTAPEIARQLGVTGLQFRNFLRALKAEGDPRVSSHHKHSRYAFTRKEAESLKRDFRKRHGQRDASHAIRASDKATAAESARTRRSRAQRPSLPRGRAASAALSIPRLRGAGHHQVREEWMGKQVTTLADLLRPGLRAVVIGINPAPPSVAAGHYWQGNTGKTLWRRLRTIGALPVEIDGYEDDAAFAAGIGFTDVVKRPTAKASEVAEQELAHGRELLEGKLAALDVPLVIFAFKQAATTLLGGFDGNGLLRRRKLGGAKVFVMPGPYAPAQDAKRTLRALKRQVHA